MGVLICSKKNVCCSGMSAAPRFAVMGPEMLRGIGAPGPPVFGARKQRLGREPAIAVCDRRAAQQTDIAFRKRVGVAKRAERPILCGPWSPSRQSQHARDSKLIVAGRFEELPVFRSRFGERLEAGDARAACRAWGDRPSSSAAAWGRYG